MAAHRRPSRAKRDKNGKFVSKAGVNKSKGPNLKNLQKGGAGTKGGGWSNKKKAAVLAVGLAAGGAVAVAGYKHKNSGLNKGNGSPTVNSSVPGTPSPARTRTIRRSSGSYISTADISNGQRLMRRASAPGARLSESERMLIAKYETFLQNPKLYRRRN